MTCGRLDQPLSASTGFCILPPTQAPSFTLPLSLSFSLKIWVTLLTLAQICPMKSAFVQSPRVGIKWGLMLQGERCLSVHRNSVLSVWGEYIDKHLYWVFFWKYSRQSSGYSKHAICRNALLFLNAQRKTEVFALWVFFFYPFFIKNKTRKQQFLCCFESSTHLCVPTAWESLCLAQGACA